MATKKAAKKSAARAATKRPKKAAPEWKAGDRIRCLRTAARNWEVGSVKDLIDGHPATAKLDNGEVVGLSGLTWERQG